MDFCRNVSVSGGLPSEYPPEKVLSPAHEDYSASLDDLFPCHNTEGDVNLEWLSIFVEDCLTSSGNCIPLPQTSSEKCKPLPQTHHPQNNNPIPQAPPKGTIEPKPLSSSERDHKTPQPLKEFSIPGKARSKRKRGSNNTPRPKTTTPMSTFHVTHSDPPLLFHQSHWLADSELIVPKRNIEEGRSEEEEKEMEEEKMINGGWKDSLLVGGQQPQAQARRCTHCLSQRTPQWRAGPLGPKTLCNACGVRFKSGRLLPEYRPAKSPTFVSYKHSNSHKKVLEMRSSLLSSSSSSE